MKMKFRLGWLLCACILLHGCDPDPIVLPDRGEGYYPLFVGQVLEYRVDSIIFDDGPGNTNRLDTLTGYIRERITSANAGSDGDTVYLIERSHRKTLDDPWTTTGIWTTQRDLSAAVRTEGSQRLVKMEFPLFGPRVQQGTTIPGTQWDPTRFIDPGINVPVGTEEIELYAYWHGTVLSLDMPETIGNFQYDQVMTCRQADEDNEIERRYVLEKYAKNVGLVFRVDSIIDSYCKRIGDFAPCIGKNWMQKGEKGYILRLELISHN